MPIGDAVICPICAEVAYIIEEEDDGMFYGAHISCDQCKCTYDIVSKPTKVDSIHIKYRRPASKGQLEFPFVKKELNKIGEH